MGNLESVTYYISIIFPTLPEAEGHPGTLYLLFYECYGALEIQAALLEVVFFLTSYIEKKNCFDET